MTQLPPEGISQSAWDEAEAHIRKFSYLLSSTEIVARAIVAATAAERERCALIADVGSDIRPDATDPLSTGVAAIANDRAKAIAAAIRKPQNDNYARIPITGEIS